ncbi:hypothetical protein K431DRAFT_280714 [Polychaeton citri CBS 116435]|uniref:AN1-type domain-containing protein n=1 Tax=Polychaeton citri CBS 116435 TaxID=1314669 RepID=A0A9P4QJP1_9PEZI|nr:hypothetical protein K431DRAFT_280714 [Polychaeton citri CBS 116435]
MSVGDVEAIGARCQMPFCRQLDFLPFKCESCKGQFCLDHRTESAHTCSQAGAWARRRAEANGASPSRSSPKPSILTHEQQCASSSCKTLIHTALVTGVHCDRCRREYCLKHRFQQDHDCSNLTPLGLKVKEGPTQKEKGIAALDRLRAWGSAKKASGEKKLQTKTQASAAARIQQTAQLKKTAKGDAKVPIDKRIYLYVEASSDTITAKIPKGNFFYNAEFSVGRILDLAAQSLQVQNLNNRSEKEEDKLRIFHVEGGRLLGFGEQLGKAVQTGNTIVLLRGVGPGLAKTPEQTA